MITKSETRNRHFFLKYHHLFTRLEIYLKLTRPDHWFKNIFMIPGFLIAYISLPHEKSLMTPFLLGLISACLICSANYVINEWLDRDFDQYHPVKKMRPSVVLSLRRCNVFLEYFLLALVGLLLANRVSTLFLWTSIALLCMGIVYNVKPFRTKDIIYLDVLSESINNPIRLVLGWSIVTSTLLPPSSLLLSYWMGGAYLMAMKRFSEFRFINDPIIAGQYRQSFKYYSDQKLLVSAFFYAVCSSFFGGVFLIKYKTELILTFPFYAMLFSWYLSISFKPQSAAQHPERMYEEKYFLLFVSFVSLLTTILLFIQIPFLTFLLKNIFR